MKKNKVRKETDKKTAVMQLVIMALIGAVIGGTGSIIFVFWGEDVGHMLSQMSKYLTGAASWVLMFLSLFLMVAAPLCVRNIKERLDNWHQEEEEEAEKLQQYMERVQMFLAIFMNVTMCICGIALADLAMYLPGFTAFLLSITEVQ